MMGFSRNDYAAELHKGQLPWISVKDRLPETDEPVWVWYPSAQHNRLPYTIASYDLAHGWKHIPDVWIPAITHWMKAEPPEEEAPWPRPECQQCQYHEPFCRICFGDKPPPLDAAGVCEGASKNTPKPAEGKDQPTIDQLECRLDHLEDISGCPPDVRLETWLLTLYGNLGDANDMRGELKLLREFLGAVADDRVGAFAQAKKFICPDYGLPCAVGESCASLANALLAGRVHGAEAAKDQAAAEIRLLKENIREFSGCPPDMPFESWLIVVRDKLRDANDLRAEADLLREFVQAVAGMTVICFAKARGFSAPTDEGLKSSLGSYYSRTADEVLASKSKL